MFYVTEPAVGLTGRDLMSTESTSTRRIPLEKIVARFFLAAASSSRSAFDIRDCAAMDLTRGFKFLDTVARSAAQ